MKGITLSRDLVILVIVLLICVVIIVAITYKYFFGKEDGKTRGWIPILSEDTALSRLCPDWVANKCDFDNAQRLGIKVGTTYKTVAELCSNRYTGSYNNWGADVYDKCKRYCNCG